MTATDNQAIEALRCLVARNINTALDTCAEPGGPSCSIDPGIDAAMEALQYLETRLDTLTSDPDPCPRSS